MARNTAVFESSKSTPPAPTLAPQYSITEVTAPELFRKRERIAGMSVPP